MNGAQPPSEAEYTRAAHQALDRGELRLAFVQIAGALSYRPNAPELRGLLEVALARSKQPLASLPSKGDAFFGVGAVRAAALARAGKLGDAIVQLLDVVTFRPSAPFLLWLDEWRARGLRGVRVEDVAAATARFHQAIDRVEAVAPENLVALAALLNALRDERPKATTILLRLEAITLRQLGDLEQAEHLVDQQLAKAQSIELLLEKAANQRARADFSSAIASLQLAQALAPSDSSLALDLADDYLRAGDLAEATRAYQALLESARNAHATSVLLGLAALQQPNDRELREKALASSVRDQTLPELALALRIGRTVLPPWPDVLANALDDLLDGLRRDPPASRSIRVRLQLDEPLPHSARVLFRAAAHELGVEAELVNDAEGEAAPLSEFVAPSDDTAAQVLALAQSSLDLDRWAEPGPRLPLEQTQRAFAAPLPGILRNFAEFERQRLAVLSLALRASDGPNDEAFTWALALANAGDAWAAHTALLALGAAARRCAALAPLVVSAASSALAREDARSLAAAAVQVHSAKEHVDAQTRGRALTCLVVAGVEARQAWLVDRSHGRATLDSAVNDATLQR